MTHITITGSHQTSTLKLYINGVKDKEVVARPFEASTRGYYLGKHVAENKPDANWVGLIDELYLLNVALDEDQIKKVMNNEALFTAIDNAKYADNTMLFYPNPTNGLLSTKNNSTGKELLIYNLSGQVLLKALNVKQLDLTDFKAGLYLLKYTTEQSKLITEKLIIK